MDQYSSQSDERDAEYLLNYLDDVLIPASDEFLLQLGGNSLKLHHVVSFNAILAHAVDYMIFIAKKKTNVSRASFIKSFDERYAVDGCININRKFALLDAVNNSFKHVELDKERYKDLIERYGALSFHSLKHDKGKIYFDMPSYRFDYSRVVLRPIAAIFGCNLKTTKDIDDFINGKKFGSTGYGSFSYEYEPHDAIDRMTDHINARCMDCGETNDDCDCPNFVYGNEKGVFNPNIDPSFDFDDVMSDISGTREWSR